MAKYYIPSEGPIEWRKLLADPEKQWKMDYSAHELAYAWEEAKEFPTKVVEVFKESGLPLFNKVEILYAFPEYKVSLPGGGASSQNDLYVLAKADKELVPIMVEGKASESFGKKVRLWLGDKPSDGKTKRLEYLLSKLGLQEKHVLDIRYQLLHRTVSALDEAEKVNAKQALMLVHSFSKTGRGFDDYAAFVEFFQLSPEKDKIVGPVQLDGVDLYFGWVTDEVGKKSKPYFWDLFKTVNARKLAREIDHYICNVAPYADEVEDYHKRYKSGVRTDCIGYVSSKGSNKFATITAARKVCFVLHLGRILHKETAEKLQKEVDELLGHIYVETDQTTLTPGEVYIRLEWVDQLEQITRFIDKAYELRLEK